MKRCNGCKRDLPSDAFAANRRNADGLQQWCRVCSNEASKMRRAALQRNQSEQERREDDVRRAMRMLQLMTPGLR